VKHMQFVSGNLQWSIDFIGQVHNWAVDLVTMFFDLLYCIRLGQGGEDRICWTPSKRWKFEVRSFYHVLSNPASSPFPRKSIWRVNAHLRGAFCVDSDTREDFDFE